MNSQLTPIVQTRNVIPLVPPILCPSCGSCKPNQLLPEFLKIIDKSAVEKVKFFDKHDIKNLCCRARLMGVFN